PPPPPPPPPPPDFFSLIRGDPLFGTGCVGVVYFFIKKHPRVKKAILVSIGGVGGGLVNTV
ncbi:hypothetical protein ACVGV7_00195, partial [Enterobacter intestinihominis]